MLADQSYGLRFDIYERIHLSEDVIGIEELEEIELYPKIQVIPGKSMPRCAAVCCCRGCTGEKGRHGNLRIIFP